MAGSHRITTFQPNFSPTVAPGGAKQSFSRADIVELGGKGKPWEFLPVAARALEIAPGDTGLVMLTAANLAACGLGVLASEALAMLPDHARTQDPAVRLEEMIRRLPDDRVRGAQRVGAAALNLEAISEHHPQAAAACREAWSAWEAGIDQTESYRALDGNVVRRPAGGRGLRACLSLVDQRGQARDFAEQVAPPTEQMGRPLVIEGISPPWVFAELMRSTAQGLNGYERRMVVVQADPAEFLDGLSYGDFRELLTQPRVELHVGPRASTSLARAMASRMETVLVGRYIPVLATRTRAHPPVEHVLGELERQQQVEHKALCQAVADRYQTRTPRWWRDRYTSGQPLRVLIPTCRFSTFVRTSSEDLAAAFEAAGHRARVVMEPDAHSSLSSIGYLRAIADFDPDLVVLINYPRAAIGQFFPASVPYICWVQDAMPHLFDARLGAAQGDLDFLAGVRLPELVNRFGFRADRCLPAPVVVSDRKFGSAAAAASCESVEIVYATHHGETPEAMHQRLMREASRDAVLPRAMELLGPLAREIGSQILAPDIKKRIREGVIAVLGGLTGEVPPERMISVLTHAYVIPMADRVLRHQTAGWAASIAQRRGWTLRLCGKNWTAHPTLARFAAPPLEHGEALRDSYARATVHLHASFHGAFHQRVFECVLAGGLPLCRLVWPTISPLLGRARANLRERLGVQKLAELAAGNGANARCMVDDHPELREVAAFIGSAGLDPLPGWRPGECCEISVRPPAVRDTEEDTADLVPPMVLLSFRSEAQLEDLVERAATDPAWRKETSRTVAAGVRARLTHEVLSERMIGMVASTLRRCSPGLAEAGARRPTLTAP